MTITQLVPGVETWDDGLSKWLYTWQVVRITPEVARKLIDLLEPIAKEGTDGAR